MIPLRPLAYWTLLSFSWLGSEELACAEGRHKKGPAATHTASAPASSSPEASPPAPSAQSLQPAQQEPPSQQGQQSQQEPQPQPEPQPQAEPRADNRVEPSTDQAALERRAQGLFAAIVQNDPALAEALWFPQEPFLRLKAIDAPEKYWRQLHRSYARDIDQLHRQKKDWSAARFLKLELGSRPKWVEPGKEANSIGYYRRFHSKLWYEQNGRKYSIDIHTLITWQGQYYVTHLRPFR